MTARNLPRLLVTLWVIAGISSVGRAATTQVTSSSTPATNTAPSSGTTAAGAKTTSHSSSTHHKKKKAANVASSPTPVADTGKKKVVTSANSPVTASAPGGQPGTAVAAASTTADNGTTSSGKRRKTHLKHTAATATTAPKPPLSSATPSGTITIDPTSTLPPAPTIVAPASPTRSAAASSRTPIVITAPAGNPPTSSSAGPEVETGLPVARHGGYDPAASTDVHRGDATTGAYQVASAIPVPVAASLGSYASRTHVRNPLDSFTFTNFTRHVRNIYPWKINIFTTLFWIGEGDTPVSSTTNDKSAWDADWQYHNGGTDTPNDREGFMPAHHAARENPFYVALPFNDLKYPDLARQYLPSGWARPSKDGKQVSACQHRWLEIKNGQGEVCYAQWEDVGPLTYSDASYVFGESRPMGLGNLRAGLDVSPAVAQYLNITGKNCLTRWRFVDDADVVPGRWLQYDEEALIFRAMHDLKSDPGRIQPIQRATAPIDDEEDIDSTKKRLGAAKG